MSTDLVLLVCPSGCLSRMTLTACVVFADFVNLLSAYGALTRMAIIYNIWVSKTRRDSVNLVNADAGETFGFSRFILRAGCLTK